MIYYLTHVIYANGKKALACWCKDEKLTVTNHIYLKNQLFDVYLYTSRSCHFCGRFFQARVVVSIWHFSVLQVRDNHFCRRRCYCCSLLSPQPRESPCRNGLPASRSWMVAPHFPRRWHSVVLRHTCQMPSSHSTTLFSTSSPFSFSSLAGIPNPRWMPILPELLTDVHQ